MAQLSGGDKLARVDAADPQTGALFRSIIAAVNRGFRAAGVSAVGEVSAPHPPTGLNVQTGGESLHYSIEHPGVVNRGINYISEIATDAQFNNVVTIRDHGASRTPEPIRLPANDASGNPHRYYLRAYAQNPGSPPSTPYVHGGSDSPTPITLAGSTGHDFARNTGSGTASNSGGQNGFGLGRFPVRTK